MSEKIVKARKDHICVACQGLIPKGDLYSLIEEKHGKYELTPDGIEDGTQIGISFVRIKLHKHYCGGSDEDIEEMF